MTKNNSSRIYIDDERVSYFAGGAFRFHGPQEEERSKKKRRSVVLLARRVPETPDMILTLPIAPSY